MQPHDFDAGRAAGYRGDELVTEKSSAYMEGYEFGLLDKENYQQCLDQMKSSSVAEPVSRSGEMGLKLGNSSS